MIFQFKLYEKKYDNGLSANDIILNDMIIVMQFSDIIFKIGISSRLFFE